MSHQAEPGQARPGRAPKNWTNDMRPLKVWANEILADSDKNPGILGSEKAPLMLLAQSSFLPCDCVSDCQYLPYSANYVVSLVDLLLTIILLIVLGLGTIILNSNNQIITFKSLSVIHFPHTLPFD